MTANILIVEDDEPLCSFLEEFLQEEGYIVETAATGSVAVHSIEERQPDMVILDLGLPDIDGETVLATVRKNSPKLPVLILTAKSGAENIAKGLNLGADDYLAKPFAAEELLARIKARMRSVDTDMEQFMLNDLVVNLNTREVRRGKTLVELTKTEFDLLHYLLKNEGKVVTRDMILNHVWGYTTDVESRVVDVYIGYLRKKIDSDNTNPLIRSMRGVGYLVKK